MQYFFLFHVFSVQKKASAYITSWRACHAHAPSASTAAAALSFCGSRCGLGARSVRTWGLFGEATLELTPAPAMAEEKPKEGVKTENNDPMNLKVAGQDGSAVQKATRHLVNS